VDIPRPRAGERVRALPRFLELHLPPWVAQEVGIFAKYGIEARIFTSRARHETVFVGPACTWRG
jgi:ABC-type nitrate/sulfonate/bicarbonate transport system substrate-binding protein